MNSTKWLVDEIEQLKKFGAVKQARELVDVLPRHTAQAISKKRTRLGIVLLDDYRSRSGKYARSFLDCCKLDQNLCLEDFGGIVFQIIIGSMLGDGCISKSKDCANYTFCEGHGIKQYDYLEWKFNKLASLFPRWSSRKNPLIYTPHHPMFTKLRDDFYPLRSKCRKGIIPMDLVSKIDLFGLMIWYLDDGYLGTTKSGRLCNGLKKSPRPSIAAKGWKYDELVQTTELLNKRLGLLLYVKQYKHKGGLNKVVYLGQSRDKLLSTWQSLAKEHNLPECMDYKLGTFKDTP